jgi:hypothetical protein
VRDEGTRLEPTERAVGWLVGVPFASWRYVSRTIEVRRENSNCSWPMDGFPEDDCQHAGRPDTLQRPSAGHGAAFRRHYCVRVERPLLSAVELMSIVLSDPNVACPLEIARSSAVRVPRGQSSSAKKCVCGCPVHGTVRCALSM